MEPCNGLLINDEEIDSSHFSPAYQDGCCTHIASTTTRVLD
jgi:hypothetical protein